MALNIIALFISVLIFSEFPAGYGLSSNYYYKTCPGVDSIVTNVVKNAVAKDKTVPAALLRMHFHDCFIRVFHIFCLVKVFIGLVREFDYFKVFFLFRVVMPLCC